MKVSLNTIKQYTTVDLGIDELVAKINQQLGSVEEVADLGDKYKDAVIVRVVECIKHPNADKLSVCKVDVSPNSPHAQFVIPDSDNLVEVVCGAPNVRADMWAIWLPPQSTVPASYGDKDPFVLDVRELRGVKSHGMLAAADELAIGSDHAGIIELTNNDLSPFGAVKELRAGLNFAETFGLNDTVIDIENKMFTHRPDLFGQLGVAREIAGIQGIQFTSPEWYTEKREEGSGKREEELQLTVTNEAKEVVPRFMAVVITGVTIKPSPFWLQCELVRLGSKPINNVVDVTNYVMLLTAQPTHAYDYDKLRVSSEQKEEGSGKKEGKLLGARFAKKSETVPLLNGKTYELDESDIVIVDGEGPVGLAGIMGGGNSEVSPTTTTIVLECASFDMYAVRKSSMRHGLFTDALTRFNKGQSPLQNPACLALAMLSIFDVAGGAQASQIFDEKTIDDRRWTVGIEVDDEFINSRLGLTLGTEQIDELLRNVEMNIEHPESNARRVVKPPFWRTDIEQPEDIVEEVGRLYGFDKLPRELPRRSIRPATKNPVLETKRAIRDIMSRAGANEVLTYSFVHEKVMKRAEQDVSQAFQLSNALSPDLQYYRLSVLPSLLDRVHANIKAGHDEFVLYEIGKGHNKNHADDDNGLPTELEFVDGVYASKKPHAGAAYYHMRKLVTTLCKELGFEIVLKPITEGLDFPVTAPFDQSRSAIVEAGDGTFVGMIGELKQSVLRSFKLPSYAAAMTLDLGGLQAASAATGSHYKPLSKYPSITQDITLRVRADVDYQDLLSCVRGALDANETSIMTESLTPLSIYQPEGDSGTKTITYRVTVTNYDRTLSDADVTALLDTVASRAKADLDAERV